MRLREEFIYPAETSGKKVAAVDSMLHFYHEKSCDILLEIQCLLEENLNNKEPVECICLNYVGQVLLSNEVCSFFRSPTEKQLFQRQRAQSETQTTTTPIWSQIDENRR